MTEIQRFFQRYEEGANTFDPGLIASHFTPSFMAGDPNGVTCIQNDEAFLQAIPERRTFFSSLGFRLAKVLDVAETPLCDRYTMAKVYWQMVFEKEPGARRDFKFFITYILFDPGDGLKVAFYISHEDEQKVMREAGLIP